MIKGINLSLNKSRIKNQYINSKIKNLKSRSSRGLNIKKLQKTYIKNLKNNSSIRNKINRELYKKRILYKIRSVKYYKQYGYYKKHVTH
jgi:hypothetical protein